MHMTFIPLPIFPGPTARRRRALFKAGYAKTSAEFFKREVSLIACALISDRALVPDRLMREVAALREVIASPSRADAFEPFRGVFDLGDALLPGRA
jgi:hypothetical protein